MVTLSEAQTTLKKQASHGGGKIISWSVISNGDAVGTAYTFEDGAKTKLHARATAQSLLSSAVMVLSPTYTSLAPDNTLVVAGNAIDRNGYQIGNPNDEYFQPNAYMCTDGELSFQASPLGPGYISVPVYKLITDNYIHVDVVNARTSSATTWRFLVQKKTVKTDHFENEFFRSVSWMIVDFDKSMTLSEATGIVAGMSRDQDYTDFHLGTSISACLLDTGSYTAFLLDKQNKKGVFDFQKQTNMLMVF